VEVEVLSLGEGGEEGGGEEADGSVGGGSSRHLSKKERKARKKAKKHKKHKKRRHEDYEGERGFGLQLGRIYTYMCGYGGGGRDGSWHPGG
jgi:hypothetical protein